MVRSDHTFLVLFAANDGGNSGTGVRPLEYLVGEDVRVTEYVLEQVNAHTDRSDAESLICIEAAIGGEPQHKVTSVESTHGVLAGSRKWVQEVPSKEGHEPAKGSDLTTSYGCDRLVESDLDIGRLEPQTSRRQRSCGTQAARQSSAARSARLRLELSDYSWWIGSSGRGLYAVPLDRHGGTVEGAVCVKVFDPGGRAGSRVCRYDTCGWSILLFPSTTIILYKLLYFIPYCGREGGKVGCVAASALHRVPVLFLPCS